MSSFPTTPYRTGNGNGRASDLTKFLPWAPELHSDHLDMDSNVPVDAGTATRRRSVLSESPSITTVGTSGTFSPLFRNNDHFSEPWPTRTIAIPPDEEFDCETESPLISLVRVMYV